MTEENCYLFAKIEEVSDKENVFWLHVHRKDLEGNPSFLQC